MAYELVSGAAEKAVGDAVRLPMDFGDIPELIAGAIVVSFDVTCTGATGTPPTVSGKQLDYPYQLSALFTGGTAGNYDATYTITLNDTDGTVIQRTALLKVY